MRDDMDRTMLRQEFDRKLTHLGKDVDALAEALRAIIEAIEPAVDEEARRKLSSAKFKIPHMRHY